MKRKKNKQPKLHVRTGDTVRIISGKHASSKAEGEVVSVNYETQRAIVRGYKMVTKHVKPSANKPQGEMVTTEAGIHISNLMVIDPATGEPRRSGRRRNAEGKLERYFKEHTSRKDK